MKKALPLLALTTVANAAVLRGQSETPTRLFRIAKKGDKKKHASDKKKGTSSAKASAGSAASAVKNPEKCKTKKKLVGVAASNVAVASSTGSAAATATATSSTASAAAAAVTTASTTTTSATTTTTTTATTASTTSTTTTSSSSKDAFALYVGSNASTRATSNPTEGVTDIFGARIADLSEDTGEEVDGSTFVWVDICDQDGNLIPPNTYWPTISPRGDDFFGMDIDDTDDAGIVDTLFPMDVNDTVPTEAPVDSGFVFQPTAGVDDGMYDDDDDDASRTESPGCQAYADNQVYETSISASVSFLYEISIPVDVNVTSVLQELEEKRIRLLGDNMIHCTSVRSLRHNNNNGNNVGNANVRRLEKSQVDGISSDPPDYTTDSACITDLASSTNADTATACYSIRGGNTLYLRENSPYSSAEQSSTAALKLLMTNMNNERAFVSGSYEVTDLLDIRYISGTPDQDLGVIHDGSSTVTVGGAAEQSINDESETKNLSNLGISLISIGTVVTLTLLLAVARRVQSDDDTYEEFEEDNDLDKEWANDDDLASVNRTAESISSNDSQRDVNRMAIIYNEEESVVTDVLSSSILRQLRVQEENEDHSSVHKRPVFLSTQDDTEGVEVFNMNKSIYIQHSELSSPTYENPAELCSGVERSYCVDDTVEF